MVFDIEKYNGINTPDKMACLTVEESQVFRAYLDKVGRKWHSGDSYLLTDYDHNIDSTTALIYYFNNGTYSAKPHRFIDDGYLMFSDFVWDVDGSGVSIDMSFDEMLGKYRVKWRGAAMYIQEGCAFPQRLLIKDAEPWFVQTPIGYSSNSTTHFPEVIMEMARMAWIYAEMVTGGGFTTVMTVA